jgi:hypothetical protein
MAELFRQGGTLMLDALSTYLVWVLRNADMNRDRHCYKTRQLACSTTKSEASLTSSQLTNVGMHSADVA